MLYRGSAVLSGLVHYYQDRFHAFAWLAINYVPPNPIPFDWEKALAGARSVAGNDMIGYQRFFYEPDDAALCQKNVSFSPLSH